MNISLLPNNREPLPKRLVYASVKKNFCSEDNYAFGKSNFYNMIDLETKELVGQMITTNSTINNKPSLYIDYLKSYSKNANVGSDFIEFAENISKNSVNQGRIHLLATKLRDETCYPHLFYRKKGFKTDSILKNFIYDVCLLFGKKQCKLFSGATKMFK